MTRYDIQTYPLLHTQYTVHVYSTAAYARLHDAVAQLQEAMERDPRIGAFVNVQDGAVAVGLLYAAWADERPKAFDPFFVDLKDSLLQTVVPTTNGTMKTLVDALELLDGVPR